MSDRPVAPQNGSRAGSRFWNLLLVPPFIAMLWVSSYNTIEPAAWGIPFFYWYQFAWVFITSAIIIFVHRMTG
jgi:Protein of unknown function (DUF3311)